MLTRRPAMNCLALDSGSYTVQVTDPDQRSGTSLLELYLAP